jgi:hypothetical protein
VSLVVWVARRFSTLFLKRLACFFTLLVFNLSQTTCTMQHARWWIESDEFVMGGSLLEDKTIRCRFSTCLCIIFATRLKR